MAVGLLLLAPTVGEYLLGNIPLSQYGDVLFLMPLYGAGALLVRESARRLGRGWPTIVLFAAAYALVEEGPRPAPVRSRPAWGALVFGLAVLAVIAFATLSQRSLSAGRPDSP